MRKSPNKDFFKISHSFLMVWWHKLRNNCIIQALRAFRVLRPLRLVSGVPSLQVNQRVYNYREDNPFFGSLWRRGQQMDSGFRGSCLQVCLFVLPFPEICVELTQLYHPRWGGGGGGGVFWGPRGEREKF
jgi:hypothetical protein